MNDTLHQDLLGTHIEWSLDGVTPRMFDQNQSIMRGVTPSRDHSI